MDKTEARRRLQVALMKGSLAYTEHARERMAERKFTAQDILRALQGGTMPEEPKPCKHASGFECVMRTRLDDGRVLEVPIVVDEGTSRIIVKSVVRK